MATIALQLGGTTTTFTITAGQATRIINAAAARRGLNPAVIPPIAQAIARDFMRDLKEQTAAQERSATVIADIPHTES